MHGWLKGLILVFILVGLVSIGSALLINATDSDIGDDAKNAGTCRDSWSNNDTCLNDVLLEFYPIGAVCKYKFYNCPKEFSGMTCKTNDYGIGYCG